MDERVSIASSGDFHIYEEGDPPRYCVYIVSSCFECFDTREEAAAVMQEMVNDIGPPTDDEPLIERPA